MIKGLENLVAAWRYTLNVIGIMLAFGFAGLMFSIILSQQYTKVILAAWLALGLIVGIIGANYLRKNGKG